LAEGLVNKVDSGAGKATMDVEDEGSEFAVGAVGCCLVFGDFVRIGILVGLVLVVLVNFNVGSGGSTYIEEPLLLLLLLLLLLFFFFYNRAFMYNMQTSLTQ